MMMMMMMMMMMIVCVCISHFFSNPAEVAATAATTGKRGRMANGWFLGFPTPHSRGRRMAQSDGLVRLTILSADGHPKGARVVTSYRVPNSSQQPSPPQKASPPFCVFFSGNLNLNLVENSLKTENRKTQNTKTHTGFSGEFFDFSK